MSAPYRQRLIPGLPIVEITGKGSDGALFCRTFYRGLKYLISSIPPFLSAFGLSFALTCMPI